MEASGHLGCVLLREKYESMTVCNLISIPCEFLGFLCLCKILARNMYVPLTNLLRLLCFELCTTFHYWVNSMFLYL